MLASFFSFNVSSSTDSHIHFIGNHSIIEYDSVIGDEKYEQK